VKNSVRPQEGHCEKKCEIQGGSQEMDVMVGSNFLITTIQVNLSCLFHVSLPNLPKLLLLKKIPISSNSWLSLWIFHLFFTMAFLEPHTFFIAGLFWIRFYFFL